MACFLWDRVHCNVLVMGKFTRHVCFGYRKGENNTAWMVEGGELVNCDGWGKGEAEV